MHFQSEKLKKTLLLLNSLAHYCTPIRGSIHLDQNFWSLQRIVVYLCHVVDNSHSNVSCVWSNFLSSLQLNCGKMEACLVSWILSLALKQLNHETCMFFQILDARWFHWIWQIESVQVNIYGNYSESQSPQSPQIPQSSQSLDRDHHCRIWILSIGSEINFVFYRPFFTDLLLNFFLFVVDLGMLLTIGIFVKNICP